MSLPNLDETTLDDLYQWLETIPFSRQKKNITKDFSDGVLVAEIVAHFLPRYVDLNNYTPASSTALKKYNWETLNKKVFEFLDFSAPQNLVNQVVNMRPGAIEFVLCGLRAKIDLAIGQQRFRPKTKHRRSRSTSRSRGDNSLSAHSVSDISVSDLMSSSLSISTPGNNRYPRERNLNLVKLSGIPNSTPSSAREQLCEDLVPTRLLHAAQQELLTKDEQINTLHARLRHMERLVQLKDERIDQLSQRLDRLAQVFYQHQKVSKSPAQSTTPQPPASPQISAQTIVQNLLSSLSNSTSPQSASSILRSPSGSTPPSSPSHQPQNGINGGDLR